MLEAVALACLVVLWDLGRRFAARATGYAKAEDVKELQLKAQAHGETVSRLEAVTTNQGLALASLQQFQDAASPKLADHTKVLANHAATLAAQGQKITAVSAERMFGGPRKKA